MDSGPLYISVIATACGQFVGKMEISRAHRAFANSFIVWMTISTFVPISAKLSLAETAGQQLEEQVVRYSNTWAVEVHGGAEEADALAQKHGLINRGQVILFRNIHVSELLKSVFLQIGNQQHYYLFMEGETARMVTKDLTDIMATKTAALKSEQKV